MRPRLHYDAKEFNEAKKHAKDHGNGLLKYAVVVDGKKVVRYYSGKKLPKHIAARVVEGSVEEKKV